jgi:hypothetical protein
MAQTEPDAPPPPASTPSEVENEPILRHVVHVIRRYRAAILVWLAAVAMALTVALLALFLLAPSQEITTLPFRLDFEGADRGTYPSGSKFTPSEIIGTPVLLRVFNDNNLGRYCSFAQFSRGVFVLESNQVADELAREYTARLADTRLSAIDRERLEREYELKRASISKSDYALNFSNFHGNTLPPSLAKKALSDILKTWAQDAMVEKKVLEYHVPVLSQKVLDRKLIASSDPDDYVVLLTVLRMKAQTLAMNLNQIAKIPGVEVVRSRTDRASLQEVSLQLDDLVRYRIEPMIKTLCSSGMVRSPASTLSVLQSQLSYDERNLQAAQQREQSLRDAFSTYEKGLTPQGGGTASSTATQRTSGEPNGGGGETVTPQINDTFLDRIVRLSTRIDDRVFRQAMVTDIKNASVETIAPQANVLYDRELIETVKSARPGAADASTQARIKHEIDTVYADLQGVVTSLSEIHAAASQQLNPVTELFTFAAAPTVRREAALQPIRLIAFGLMLFLMSIPVVIAGCLIHERVEIENAAEDEIDPELHGAASS